jgi:small subunit ribosomal protein S20
LANHKSSIKKIKQDVKRGLRNKAVRTRYRNLIKAVGLAVESGDAERADEALKICTPYLQRSVSKGVMHKNKAARTISRLTKKVQALSAAA